MSTAAITQDIQQAGEGLSRGRAIWLAVVQCAALGVLIYTLFLAGQSSEAVPQSRQALLAVLALFQLVIAIVPVWRGSQFAGALGAVSLATACWLSAEATLEWSLPGDWSFLITEVPAVVPAVVLAVLVLAIWGLAARGGLADASRLGVAAVVGMLLLAFFSVGFFRLVNFTAFKSLYMIESYQLVALLASVILYPAALWLGSAGLRSPGGIRLQPLCMAAVLIGFLAYWHVH